MTCSSTKIKVKIVPGASNSGIIGWLGDTLKVRISAPPEKGKANAAIVALISDALHVPECSVHIVSGRNSQRKMIEIHDLSRNEILQRLANIV